MNLLDILTQAQVIPVITLENSQFAVPLAKALLNGGINTIEITLRTFVAIDCIEKISSELPEVIVGAGTVVHPHQFAEVKNAGAQFAVSPGLTEKLANAGNQSGLPYLPAAVTTSEIIAAQEWGFEILKFFPAGLAGGVKALKTSAALFPSVGFCPTGGVDVENMADYLSLPNVVCIAGSWIAPLSLINQQDWSAISALAREAKFISSHR